MRASLYSTRFAIASDTAIRELTTISFVLAGGSESPLEAWGVEFGLFGELNRALIFLFLILKFLSEDDTVGWWK